MQAGPMQGSGKYSPGALLLLCVLVCLPAPAAELQKPAVFPAQSVNPALSTNSGGLTQNIPDLLPAEQVFHPEAFVETDGSITLLWDYPENFYLYSTSIAVLRADGTALALELPETVVITDEYFGEVNVWFDRLLARVPAAELGATAGSTIELRLTFQGCAKDLYCYPPQQLAVSVQFPE